MIRDREEEEAQATSKEAQVAKDPSTATISATYKGKNPMEDIPQESVNQQLKSYLHTLEQIKQKLTKITSVLDTQEIVTSKPVKDTQVTTIVDKAQSEQTQVEKKPLKVLKAQISSFPASTIDLTNSEEEDE